MRTWLIGLTAAILAFTAMPWTASADAPYEAYTYNYYRDSVPIPAPYLPERAVTGEELGVGAFKGPNDLYATEDGRVYILDSGNGRIVRTDKEWNALGVIDGFDLDGKRETFGNPGGLFVTGAGDLYVADTDRGRIVVLAEDGELKRVIGKPESDILPADFQFNPTKVTVDRAGRVFVVARGVFEGLMQFDENGQFIGYAGTIGVTQTFSDRLWRSLATDAQRQRMQLFIPTEFSSVDIDHKGFVYATSVDLNSETPIRRLNPSGQDVLKRFGYYPVRGDVRFRIFGNNAGPSRLTDIKVLGGGMYTALDTYRGRLFTYNDEGELLHAFGGKGTQLGVFNTPVAVEQVDGKLAVLDRGKNNIVVFEPTLFGSTVRRATELRYEGNDAEAVGLWEEVLRLNSNYDLAYLGIGKSLLMEKKNKEAMAYFKLGMQRDYYSIAYKRYRREVMQEHFGTLMSGAALALFALAAFLLARRWRKKGGAKREAGAL
ncbi:NHL repeat-containing protein [Paenibacillus arenilitoris]|uniref:NHL repeat-containing protein n=1 Tax=Paenibacillus arenilitoris TaxID=2772299 RepID=A0A927H5U3_9BACL|nr:NHL repeat-containing protein [Paenibacillus arenilitoris]MBD2869300.1 NHL repeat-containing protein [Paenibacillus arenilitoris]